MTIKMTYPDEMDVSEEKVKMWYSDGIANGEIQPDWWPIDLRGMVDALNDAGNVTLFILD